jgi:glycosyltransferase involved in cell wall biosynthesis
MPFPGACDSALVGRESADCKGVTSMTLRILIVSENISMRMGGEASLPFYYAKLFTDRGAEVRLACHERVENEVRDAFPELSERLYLVRDTVMQRLVYRYSAWLPYRIRDLFVGQLLHVSTQRRIRRIAGDLARAGLVDVVFEPSPITPRGLSFMYDIGVPVVIGPLCGGMNFPPAFAHMDSWITRRTVALGRAVSNLLNQLVPGKLEAAVLLAANESTVKALPAGYKGRVLRLFESGVDLDIWSPAKVPVEPRADDSVRFVFSGRFIDLKGILFLLEAFAKAVATEPRCRLDLIGGGDLEGEVRATVDRHAIGDAVRLCGWMSRPEAARILGAADVFVMPSLRECGGTAILEALALGKPVITTQWGGPADYVDGNCGVLVAPSSVQGFIDGLAEAMVRLARSPEERRRLGEGGMRRVREDHLEWGAKADRMLAILDEVRAGSAPRS